MSSSGQTWSLPTHSQIEKRIARVRKAFHQSAFLPIASRQEITAREPRRTKGPVWVTKVKNQGPPENSLLQVLRDAITELGDGTEKYDLPGEVGELEAQWVGSRNGIGKDEFGPEAASTQENYGCMMKEVKSDVVVLYAYGGAFMIGGPISARPLCTELARLTKGRCYLPKYRLAPQNPFPAAILDILHAYLTLISPPPGSLHKPVAPSSIVFAGDSAGACLVLAAVQVLLSSARATAPKRSVINFHGKPVELRLPAGVAIASLLAENVLATPSWTANAASDVFHDDLPALDPGFPSDAVWPSHPPRGHPYAESLTLLHPLVSLCATPAWAWKGAPPLWIAVGGGERLLDSAKILVRDMLSEGNGGRVQWVVMEKMPHLFTTFQDWWQAKKTTELWVGACKAMVKGDDFASGGMLYHVDQSEEVVELSTLTKLRKEDVLKAMREKAIRMKVWYGKKNASTEAKL